MNYAQSKPHRLVPSPVPVGGVLPYCPVNLSLKRIDRVPRVSATTTQPVRLINRFLSDSRPTCY